MIETSRAPRLQHVVLISFPDEVTEELGSELCAMVFACGRQIRPMDECRIGADLTGERTRGYDFLLYTIFPDADALAAYVAHPVHQTLVRWLDAHECQRLAFDYYLDASTDAFA